MNALVWRKCLFLTTLDTYCIAMLISSPILSRDYGPSTFIAQMMVPLYLQTVDQGLNHGWILCSSYLIVVFDLAMKGSKLKRFHDGATVLPLLEVFVPLYDLSAMNRLSWRENSVRCNCARANCHYSRYSAAYPKIAAIFFYMIFTQVSICPLQNGLFIINAFELDFESDFRSHLISSPPTIADLVTPPPNTNVSHYLLP